MEIPSEGKERREIAKEEEQRDLMQEKKRKTQGRERETAVV